MNRAELASRRAQRSEAKRTLKTAKAISRPHSAKVFGTIKYALSNIDGGKAAFLEYLRLAASGGSIVATTFLAKWDELTPKERKETSLDDIAESMELSVPNLVGTVAAVMVKQSENASKLLAALHQPKVVEALAKAAETPTADFAQDRKTFLQATGFLPTKHGSSIHLNVNQQNNNREVQDGNPRQERVINSTAKLIAGDED